MRGVSAICAGSFSAVAVGIPAAWLAGGLGPWVAWLSLTVGMGVGLWAGVFTRDADSFEAPGPWALGVLAIFALAAFRAFFWVIYPSGDELRVLSPHNLGDMALHLGLIRYFAAGVPFWPASPILVGEPLTYPPGPDFFNALLLVCGMDLRSGLVVAGFGMALTGGWALYRFGGGFAVAALLFGGGLAGFAIFRNGEFVEYADGLVWKNAFLTMLVTQRGFLFALSAGILLLWAWRGEFFGGCRRVPLAVQWLLYAAMPLFQVHTFLFLSAALAGALIANPKNWHGPCRLAALAFVPASLAMVAVTNGFRSGGALRWDPFWTLEGAGWSGFLLEFGVALGLCGLAAVLAFRNGDASERWLAGVCALVAAGGFFVPVTDWAWDNTKFLIWSWLGFAPVLWNRVLSPLALPARATLCALLFFTGALSLAAGLDLRHGYALASRAELAFWTNRLADFPPDAVFAIRPDYNHPVLLLGRRAVCGYEGHLMSHGLDYETKLEALRNTLSLAPGWQSHARTLGANAVLLRAKETSNGVPLVLIPEP